MNRRCFSSASSQTQKEKLEGVLKTKLEKEHEMRVEILDGDEVKKGLSPDLGLSRNGVVSIVALTSPYRTSSAGAGSFYLDPAASVRANVPGIMEAAVRNDWQRPSIPASPPVAKEHVVGRPMAKVAVRGIEIVRCARRQACKGVAVLVGKSRRDSLSVRII